MPHPCCWRCARTGSLLAAAVRELAGQPGPSLSGQELTALSESQHRIEHEAACLADGGDDASTAQRLGRLTADMIGEIGARQA